jgi:excisionase family DNA binding protein
MEDIMTIKDKEQRSKTQKPYLSLEEAADYLSISKATMYQKTSRKTIKHYKCGRKILFKITYLNDYIESHQVKTSAEIEQEALDLYISEKM